MRLPDITETTRGGERRWWHAETHATPLLSVVTVQYQPAHPDEALHGKYETKIYQRTRGDGGERRPAEWSTPTLDDTEDEAMRTHGALVEMALAYAPDVPADK